MKKIIAVLAICAASLAATAHGPVMNFARTVLTTDGLPKANLPVTVRVIIHEGSVTGQNVFAEEHKVTTSPAGTVYVPVGSQNANVTLDMLDWSNKVYFMETAVDCGQGFENTVTQQIMSVPRAVHAATASALHLTSPSGKRFAVTIGDNGEISATPIQ